MKHAICMILPAVRPPKTLPNLKAMVLLLLLLVTAMLQGCGGGGGSEKNPPPVVPPTGLSYSHQAIAAMMNHAIDADVPSVTGTVSAYTVSPVLPAGLSLNSSTGVISGTPSALAAKASYTVSASNSAGSTTATIQITVGLPPPIGLSYGQPEINATENMAITPDVPTVTGTVSSFAVSPGLPPGLQIDPSTGVISGTPSEQAGASIYSVTASNAAGATSTTVQIAVVMSPRTLGFAYPQQVIGTYLGQGITPDIPAVAGTITSYTVSPELPPGLSINPSTGVISGIPTAVAAKDNYVVTGSNSGGSISSASLTMTVTSSPNILLQLGSGYLISSLRFASSRVLSQDFSDLWILWDYESGAILASGDGGQGGQNVQGFSPQTAMAGPTVAIGIPGGIEVRASSDGHFLSTIASPGFTLEGGLAETDSWQLASDGSYIAVETGLGLFVYSPTGQLVFSRTGYYFRHNNYNPSVFAAPGQVQVANGPGGPNAIETISVANGVSMVGPPYQGQFPTWFTDGGRFTTTDGDTGLVYTSAGVQEAAYPVQLGGGAGNWVFNDSVFDFNQSEVVVNVYPVGSTTPALTTYISPDVNLNVSISGTTLAIFYNNNSVKVIDLSGTTPTESDYALPARANNGNGPSLFSFEPSAFAAASGTQWVWGLANGLILDGASLSGTPRILGNGAGLSIAGGTASAAIATGSGQIFYFDPANATPEGSISLTSGKLEMSSDGSVLAASSQDGSLLNIYSIPSGTLSSTSEAPSDFTLSGSGTILGQAEDVSTTSSAYCLLQVTPVSGGPTIWSSTTSTDFANCRSMPISPDGTLIAVNNGAEQPPFVATIYQNGQQVATVSGVAIGWIDNGRLLVNNYTESQNNTLYSGCTIYNPAGTVIATPPLPELLNIQPVTSDTVYAPSRNAIYSLSTGQATWASPYPPDFGNSGAAWIGAVSGPYVVFESEGRVIAVKY